MTQRVKLPYGNTVGTIVRTYLNARLSKRMAVVLLEDCGSKIHVLNDELRFL